MSARNSNTTSDYMEWNTMLNLVHRLFNDGKFRLSLLIGCGCFFGIRISDIRKLTWEMLLTDDNKFAIIEQKTKKRREIVINQGFKKHILDCYEALGKPSTGEPCFLSQKNRVMTTQHINRLFKFIKKDYKLKIEHFSTHTMRKTFGRKVVEASGENAEMALIKLMELFNHSSVSITKRYLGIRQEELQECYNMLDF